MKTLYFDIDGTVLLDDRHEAKRFLANGALEHAARSAGFDDLVCVGNFAEIAHSVKKLQPAYDELGVLFGLCLGAFQDETWFRATVSLVADPATRAAQIDLSRDWWYVDDLAEHYMRLSGLEMVFEKHCGERILPTSSQGDGQDVIRWLQEVAC